MKIEFGIILSLWFIFIAVWVISAFGIKKTLNRSIWVKSAGFRLAIVIIVLYLLRSQLLKGYTHILNNFVVKNPILAIFGIIFCAIGIGIAVWARFNLGKNWGQPMSIKEKPDLITTGPYAYIRHPIYSGISLAMLGSALVGLQVPVEGAFWLVAFFTATIFFFSAKQEEQNMTREFPKDYPKYMQKTKMLIPFLY